MNNYNGTMLGKKKMVVVLLQILNQFITIQAI